MTRKRAYEVIDEIYNQNPLVVSQYGNGINSLFYTPCYNNRFFAIYDSADSPLALMDEYHGDLFIFNEITTDTFYDILDILYNYCDLHGYIKSYK